MPEDIRFTNNINHLNANNLTGFFVGWPDPPPPARLLEILQNSHTVWLAMEGERCVGFVNALSDGVFYAYIPLLEVLPSHQGQGLGRALVEQMMASLSDMYAIDVVCDEAVVPFYEKLGLRRCVGMVQRNYHRQSASRPSAAPEGGGEG